MMQGGNVKKTSGLVEEEGMGKGALKAAVGPWILLGMAALWASAAAAADREDADLITIGWVDHVTYGAFNTAVGIPVAVVAHAMKGSAPKFRIDKTNQQIVLREGSPGSGNFSIGAFHFGDGGDAHEAAHSKQSAILGPFYLPAVVASYLTQGRSNSMMESWASSWRNLGATMVNSRPLTLRFELGERDGQSAQRLGANFVVMERSSRMTALSDRAEFREARQKCVNGGECDADATNAIDDHLTTTNRYGDLGVNLSIAHPSGDPACSGAGGAPLKLEGTLFRRDFLGEWATVSSALRLLIDSRQETGKVVVDLDYQRVDATLLSHVLGLGGRVGEKSELALDVTGRAGAAIKGVWLLGDEASPGVMATATLGAEARLHVLDKLQVFAKKDREWGTKGYLRDADTIGAETPLLFTAKTFTAESWGIDPDKRKKPFQKGAPTRLYGGVAHERARESLGGGDTSNIKMTVFTLGGRW